MKNLFRLATFALLALPLTVTADIYDDFNDGNDAGWTHIAPLDIFPSPDTAYSFPGGNTYRILSPSSPAPGAPPAGAGPSRAGSYRGGVGESFTQFYTAVDIVDWNTTLNGMVMGLIARLQPGAGLGTTSGYIAVIDHDGDLTISSVANEAPTTIISTHYPGFDVNKDYRIAFSGIGTSLTAQLYDLPSNNLVFPVSGNSSTYSSGYSGIFVFDNSAAGTNPSDATFDNFLAAVPEPASVGLLCLGSIGLLGRRIRKAVPTRA